MKTNYKNLFTITFIIVTLLTSTVFAQTKKTTTAKATPTKTVAKSKTTTAAKSNTTPTTKPTNTTAVASNKVAEPKAEKEKAVEKKEETTEKSSILPTSSIGSAFANLKGKKDEKKGNNKVSKVPSQESSFKKGSKYLGGNVSFGSSTSTSISLFGEYGVTDYLSVGASTMVATSSLYRTFYIGGDVTVHFANLLKLGPIDPYVGVTAGYNSFKDKNATSDRDRSHDPNLGLRMVGQAGVAYYLTPKMVAFLQGSIGIVNASPFQYGGGIKFGL